MSSHLCETQDRVRELESIHVTDASSLKSSSDNVLHLGEIQFLDHDYQCAYMRFSSAGTTIAKQAESLKDTHKELSDALHTCATLEIRCKSYEEK